MDESQIINSWIKTYLLGPIEKVKSGDYGTGWRDKLRPELEKRINSSGNNVYVFDPCLTECIKTGLEPKEFHIQFRKWILEWNKEKLAEYTNLIWRGKHTIEKIGKKKARLVTLMGDIDYVLNSDFLICRMEKGDIGCGTFGEAYEGFKHNIPIYVLQTMPKEDYPVTLVGWVCASGGDFFESQEELLEFLDKKYNLTIAK